MPKYQAALKPQTPSKADAIDTVKSADETPQKQTGLPNETAAMPRKSVSFANEEAAGSESDEEEVHLFVNVVDIGQWLVLQCD